MTTYVWLLEFPRRDGQVGGPWYVSGDGYTTENALMAHRFPTREAAESHRAAMPHLAETRAEQHGFWTETA